MKVSLNWIKEYVDIDLSVDVLVDRIGRQLGAVDEVIDIGKKYQGIVVAKVVSCQPHPNADKLKVCLIDDNRSVKNIKRGKDGLVGVVCGAPNVKEGMKVAWLPPGSTVPATFDKEPLVLESREIRGVVSNGMLASSHELAISDDHRGILEMKSGQPGDDFAKAVELDDIIIDIENKMFTHRPDCFGMLGIAREIAGITHKPFKSPGRYLQADPGYLKVESKLELAIDNQIPKLVPRFMAQVIEDVEMKSSGEKIQADLRKIGVRPINIVVDITNRMMVDTGQPLHAYDYDKLCKVAGTKTAKLETRLSKKGDKLKLLGGKTITFEDSETILITSNNVPVGIGGVMGGADTEVDENTKNIVLECANFDMYSIRRTSMRHGLFTDAVTRFTKGQSPLQIPTVLQLASGFMQIVCGLKAKAGKPIDQHATLPSSVAVHVTADFINERLGLSLKINDMAKLLTNVEFEVAINGPTLAVTPPFWRTDIEIPEDIVEEIGRLYGYDKLPLELPRRSIKPPAKALLGEVKSTVRRVLSAAGANELLTYSFVHGQILERAGQDSKNSYQLANALSPDLQYFRQSLTPSLLDKVHPNIKAGHDEFALFEIGRTHNKIHGLDDQKVPGEIEMTALVYANRRGQAGQAYYTTRRYLDHLMAEFNLTLDYQPLDKTPGYPVTAPFEPARSALVSVHETGTFLGIIGELKQSVLNAFKLPDCTAAFEIGTDHLLEATQKADHTGYRPLPRFPSVEQDITLQSSASTSFGELYSQLNLNLAKLKPTQAQAELRPLSVFQPKDNQTIKNFSFRLKIASSLKTLTAQEVNTLLDKIANKTEETYKLKRI